MTKLKKLMSFDEFSKELSGYTQKEKEKMYNTYLAVGSIRGAIVNFKVNWKNFRGLIGSPK